MPTSEAKPGNELINPGDHTLILIDHQSQMAFATKLIDAIALHIKLTSRAARFVIGTMPLSGVGVTAWMHGASS